MGGLELTEKHEGFLHPVVHVIERIRVERPHCREKPFIDLPGRGETIGSDRIPERRLHSVRRLFPLPAKPMPVINEKICWPKERVVDSYGTMNERGRSSGLFKAKRLDTPCEWEIRNTRTSVLQFFRLPVSPRRFSAKAYCLITFVLVGFPPCESLSAAPANALSAEEAAEGWELLFDGQSLNGWKASEAPDSFFVEDGTLVAHGPRSHLYYMGPVQNGEFTDFEFSAEIRTRPGSNSGVYFHSRWQPDGWPATGYEVQINNSDPPGSPPPSNPSRSGGLWGVADSVSATVPDEEWFTLFIRVEGKRILTMVNDQVVADYTEPANATRHGSLAGRLLSSGTFALQAADPDSFVQFRSIKARPLSVIADTSATSAEGDGNATFDRHSVEGREFRMGWKMDGDRGVIAGVSLDPSGEVRGARRDEDALWSFDDNGNLVFSDRNGRTSVTFSQQNFRDGRWFLSGPSNLDRGLTMTLEEVPALPRVLDDETLNRIIRPWSKQIIISLNPGESYQFELRDGTARTIRLEQVRETRDSVMGIVRRADVSLLIDQRPVELVCAPYVTPTLIDGIRIQADITSGMLPDLPKQVSLSLWDANDPVVDSDAFVFPLEDYALFSHDLQAYGEVVWLGLHDGDPWGVTARHSYGIDLAGFEKKETIVAVADGTVLDLYPDTRTPYAALIESPNGVVWEYGHMDSLLPEIREGSLIRRGQPIGFLGKRGSSGNFSHIHLGLHPSVGHRAAVIRTQRLNFFPWILAAYRAKHPDKSLFALAGAHQVIRQGETCRFDASASLAFDSRITSYQWKFHDGMSADGMECDKVYPDPGVYSAELWIEDDRGQRDVGFSRIKVFPRNNLIREMPTIFMSHSPTSEIKSGQPVTFRCWMQSQKEGTFQLDFGDGEPPHRNDSYAEVVHSFAKPGLHVVTATTEVNGMPIFHKQKVLVDGAAPSISETTSPASTPALKRVDAPHLALSFDLPVDWVAEVTEGSQTYHPPGENPEAILTIQLIDNTDGTSTLADQLAELKSDLQGFPEASFLVDNESEFAGQPGHLIIGRYRSASNVSRGMFWQILSRGQYFYWIGLTFPPDRWKDGYAVLMDQLQEGFRFTVLNGDAARGASTVASAFLRDLRRGDVDGAFARTTKTFQQTTPRANFGQFVEGEPFLRSYPWFRILDNTGNADLRSLSVEFGDEEGGESLPFATLQVERTGPSDWQLNTFYLSRAWRIRPSEEDDSPAGFGRITMEQAGFSGIFPEGWIMLPEELPDGVTRVVFRPPGGGFSRDHGGIILTTLGQDDGSLSLAEGVESYLSLYAESPGFQGAADFESELNGMDAFGASFRSETEDDTGMHVIMNVVVALRSSNGAVALIHFILDTDEFTERFESRVVPIIEGFRFLE